MSEDAARTTHGTREPVSLARVLQDARTLAAERDRAAAQIVPTFPRQVQPVVQRVIDARVSELVYQRAFRTLKAALPADAGRPLDPVAFRQLREQVLALQAVLKQTGGSWFGDKLVGTLDGELLHRLAGLQDAWMQQPLQLARTRDFAWWQGEPISVAQALGSAEGVPAPSLGQLAARLDLLTRQAKDLLSLGSPALATDVEATRWRELQQELERYRAHSPDSSLARLERYLAALGADLRRDNCAERLALNAPVAAHEDAIAQRHLQLHQALSRRCQELRPVDGLPLVPSASLSR